MLCFRIVLLSKLTRFGGWCRNVEMSRGIVVRTVGVRGLWGLRLLGGFLVMISHGDNVNIIF